MGQWRSGGGEDGGGKKHAADEKRNGRKNATRQFRRHGPRLSIMKSRAIFSSR